MLVQRQFIEPYRLVANIQVDVVVGQKMKPLSTHDWILGVRVKRVPELFVVFQLGVDLHEFRSSVIIPHKGGFTRVRRRDEVKV